MCNKRQVETASNSQFNNKRDRFTFSIRDETYERYRRAWRDPRTMLAAPTALGYHIDAIIKRDEELSLQCAVQDFCDLREIHRRELEKKGLASPGMTLKIGHRHTHCWRCKTRLDAGIQASCGACGWVVCWCGACGCVYPLRWTPPPPNQRCTSSQPANLLLREPQVR